MGNRNFKIVFLIFAVLTVLAVISVAVYVMLGSASTVVSTDTDEIITFESTSETDRMTVPPDTDTTENSSDEESSSSDIEDIPYDAGVQASLDKALAEITKWLSGAVPEYEREAETDADGVEISPSETYYPPVAFFYKDLTTGASVSYNTDTVFYTASAIKAPYVLWALREIEKAEAEGISEGSKFDVNNIFVYTEDKFKEGSGIIQKSEFGTEYTYLDLLRLSISYSDNVAFAEIRNVYGRTGFNEFSQSIGVTSTAKSLYKASARDMAAYLEEIYKFFESGSEYADQLKSWMLSTNHRIMIPSAVSPTPAANKYGWDLDAYHDTAIVFDEHPYLLVVMTELDMGSRADNTFIRELVGKIDDAHKAAHEKSDN